jgi:hypothetical protein
MEYETALKKLINILKFKNTDGLRQIEDLWDTINTPIIKLKDETNEQSLPKANIKRTASDLQAINKKQRLNPTSTKQQTKKTTVNDESTKNDVNFEQQAIIIKNDDSNNSIEMKIDIDIDEKSNNSYVSSNGSSNNNDLNHNQSKIDDYAIDMGLTCDICL